MLTCYIINLDRSTERWEDISSAFTDFPVMIKRIQAVEGALLENPEKYCRMTLFSLLMGKRVTPGQVGAFMSHIKAMNTFLESGDDVGIICEDDISPAPNFVSLVEEAIKHRDGWDILRIHHFHSGKAWVYEQLNEGALGRQIRGFTPAACYAVTRKGAEFLIRHITPMCFPIDIALHHGWLNLREASLFPPPVLLTERSKCTTQGYENIKRLSLLHPFRYTALMYKVYARVVRYTICVIRVIWDHIHKKRNSPL